MHVPVSDKFLYKLQTLSKCRERIDTDYHLWYNTLAAKKNMRSTASDGIRPTAAVESTTVRQGLVPFRLGNTLRKRSEVCPFLLR